MNGMKKTKEGVNLKKKKLLRLKNTGSILVLMGCLLYTSIYEQEQPDGRFLKHIKFRFPVYFGDRETQELCWDNESTVETVILLSRKAPDAEIKVRLDMSELDITSAESKATYKEIQEYVKNKYDLHVTNSTFPADISK